VLFDTKTDETVKERKREVNIGETIKEKRELEHIKSNIDVVWQ